MVRARARALNSSAEVWRRSDGRGRDPGDARVVTLELGPTRNVRRAPLPSFPAAEQTMAMPALPLDFASRRWTPDDVDALNDPDRAWPRYECADGELLVTPAPSIDHQAVVGRLFFALTAYLGAQAVGYAFVAPLDVRLDERSLLQPDVLVTPLVDGRRPRTGDRIDRLLLAVEVLSPGSGRADRVTKRRVYQQARTPEYWVVDPDARVIERWRPDDTRPEIVDGTLEWHPEGATEPLRLDVARLLEE